MLGKDEIRRRFGSTAVPPAATHLLHYEITRDFVLIANALDIMLPDGREKNEAFTQLEDASMWAHKSASSIMDE